MTAITDVHNDLSQRLQPLEQGSHTLTHLMPKEVPQIKLPPTLTMNHQRPRNDSSRPTLISLLNGHRKMAPDNGLFILLERFNKLAQRGQSDTYSNDDYRESPYN